MADFMAVSIQPWGVAVCSPAKCTRPSLWNSSLRYCPCWYGVNRAKAPRLYGSNPHFFTSPPVHKGLMYSPWINDSAQLHQSQLWKHWYSYSLFCLVCTVCICCFFLFCFFPRVLFCLLIWTLRLIVTYTDFCSRCTLLLMCAGISAWTPLAQSWTTGQRCVWRTALSDSSTPLWPSPTASHRWCRKELICNGLYVLQQELMDWMFHSMPVENVKIFVLNVVLCSKPVTYCC